MRAALLAATILYPIAAFGQSADQGTAQMIMSSQQSQVPGGECFEGPCTQSGLVPITFQQGDVVLNGSVTDANGTVWSLAPGGCQGNPPGTWWSNLFENGQNVSCYIVGLRNVNGQVWAEQAKGSGWENITAGGPPQNLSGPFVSDPGQGSGGGQAVSAPIIAGSAADTTSASSDPPPTSDPATTSTNNNSQTCPGMTLPGAITPNGGTFTANGNTYSIDATNTDVASVNGQPINAGAYETSQLLQGSDGQIYGQSNAANNNGQWFTLQGSGGDTWWQPSSAPPVSTSASQPTTVAQSTDTTAQDRVAPTVCPQIATIQSQISAANQQIQQLMAQQAQLTAQQQMTQPTTATTPPTDSTAGNSGTQ